jgi:methylglyoxal synthase
MGGTVDDVPADRPLLALGGNRMPSPLPRHIALVAHDNKKVELLRWAEYNRQTLAEHELYATGTTGTLLEYELGLRVTRFLSGPVGGDQQIGAKIAEGLIDMLFFFWDPLEPQPHDPDARHCFGSPPSGTSRSPATWRVRT